MNTQTEAYLAELQDLSLDLNGKDLIQNGLSKENLIVGQSSENTFRERQSIQTSLKSNGINSKEYSALQEDSHVKTSVRQAKEKESQAKGQVYGSLIKKVLGFYDHKSQSLRTFQCCINVDLMLSLQILPKWGMMRNGSLYQLKRLGRCTSGKEFSLLPTPVSSDRFTCNFKRSQVKEGSRHSLRIHHALLPTIGKNEYKGSSRKRYIGSKDFHGAKMSEGLRTCETDKIYLNPYFAEAVMGFPIGWTELDAVEMQSFRKSHNLSQEGLKKSLKKKKTTG